MRVLRSAARAGLLLTLSCCLTVAGCSKRTQGPESALSSPPAAAPAKAPETPAEVKKEVTKSARLNEDGSQTLEENTGDTASRNPLLAAVASGLAPVAAAAAAPSAWKEGTNYTRLVPAQPTSASSDQVEVLEVFWYGCAHCNALDPLVEAWKKRKPAYIKFMRVPVMWDNDVHRSHARLFYTLQDLGKLEQLHPLVFKEIHVNGDPLAGADPAESEKMQLAFARRVGISQEDFTKTYHSFNVETNLQRAEQLTLRYRVTGVPTFVINGKYIADVGTAGGPDKIFSLIDDLAAQEHAR